MIYPHAIAKKVICPPDLYSRLHAAVNQIHKWSPEFISLIARNRLNELCFVNSPAGFMGDDHGGQYDPCNQANTVTINAMTRTHMMTIGQLNPSGNLGAIKMLADIATPETFDAALLTHELSHYIDRLTDDQSLRMMRAIVGASACYQEHTVSQYAVTEPCEWFAETMSAFVVVPDKLMKFDSGAFDLMKKIVTQPRILAQAA